VRSALRQKVSRERVGIELEGCFNGPRPVEAVQHLLRLQLFQEVFTVSPGTPAAVRDTYPDLCTQCLQALHAVVQSPASACPVLSTEDRKMLYLAALLLPLKDLPGAPVKGKHVALTASIIRDSLKWRVKDVEVVAVLHADAQQLLEVSRKLRDECEQGARAAKVQRREQQPGGDPDTLMVSSPPELDFQLASPEARVALGQCIRRLKHHWPMGALLAPITELPCASLGQRETLGSSAATAGGSREIDLAAAALVPSTLFAAAMHLGLEDCWQWKGLVNGATAMQVRLGKWWWCAFLDLERDP
jgi:hypothetical protein